MAKALAAARSDGYSSAGADAARRCPPTRYRICCRIRSIGVHRAFGRCRAVRGAAAVADGGHMECVAAAARRGDGGGGSHTPQLSRPGPDFLRGAALVSCTE